MTTEISVMYGSEKVKQKVYTNAIFGDDVADADLPDVTYCGEWRIFIQNTPVNA